MSISKFNSEGYFDPTAYGALSVIEREERSLRAFRPIVYICSPYAGDMDGNMEKARRYCKFAVRSGAIPLAPHLLFPQFMDDTNPGERALAMFMNMVLLGKCDQLWVFGKNISEGMAAEIGKAEKRGMAIRYFTEGMKEVDKS